MLYQRYGWHRGLLFEGVHMRRLIVGVGAIILSVAYLAEPVAAQGAADLAGSWELTMELPEGGGGRGGRGGGFGGPQTLVLSVQAEVLQGTLESQAGSIDLNDIGLQAGTITFTVERQTQRGASESTYTGEIEGNTITGTMTVGGGRFTINWTATRTET